MNIKVNKNRQLIRDSNILGTQYENLATILCFEFPEFVTKNGIDIETSKLNKYIVFDINSNENEDLIVDNKYSVPYEITKLGKVTFNIKMAEPSVNEDMSDKLIWISNTMTVFFSKSAEGKNIIDNKKLDAFNAMISQLNIKKEEIDNLINEIEVKLLNGEFNGNDYVISDEDYEDIADIVENRIEPRLNDVEVKLTDYIKKAELQAELEPEWIDIPITNSKFTPTTRGYGSACSGIQYRKVGNHVYIRAGLEASANAISGETEIAKLPEKILPLMGLENKQASICFIFTGTGKAMGRGQISTYQGKNCMTLDYLYDVVNRTHITSATWIGFYFDYYID